jgi:hypothetical protein
MRVKVRFISEVAQPAIFTDLRWLPRPGEIVELAYRKTIEVVEVARVYNDKACEAIVRGKLLQPVQKSAIATALPLPTPQVSNAPTPGQALGSKSLEEFLALARERAKEAAATAANIGTEFLRASLAGGAAAG